MLYVSFWWFYVVMMMNNISELIGMIRCESWIKMVSASVHGQNGSLKFSRVK